MTNGPTSAAVKPTIAILSAGEMGSTLGGILISQGYRVVTTASERGPAHAANVSRARGWNCWSRWPNWRGLPTSCCPWFHPRRLPR